MEYKWTDFYKEFAQKLLPYKNNRAELIEKVKQIFEKTNLKLPTLERDREVIDIDPFTVFALFNKGITDENRRKICGAIIEIFGITNSIPESFAGVPVVNNMSATFYPFIGDREDDDVDKLWDLFVDTLEYSRDPSPENRAKISVSFDKAINIRYTGNGKITMGLFWIAPETFINLDSRNTWYIYQSGKIPADVVEKLPEIEPKISAEKYFNILDITRAYLQSDRTDLKDFKDLSQDAWIYSQQVNEEQKQRRKEEADAQNVDANVNEVNYWLYSPGNNASKWDEFYQKGIMAINWDTGDLRKYNSKEDLRAKIKQIYHDDSDHNPVVLANWQFCHELKPNDVIFVKNGLWEIVGRGVVTGEYEYDESAHDFKHVRKVKWTHNGKWAFPGKQAAMKTLTNITNYTDNVKKLNALFMDESGEILTPEVIYPAYTKDDFLNEVFLKDEGVFDELRSLLEYKKNVILQGAPGVGKTHIAKRLAYAMMGEKNLERISTIQFHQSYSYEDFIMGFRPAEDGNGFELKTGVFYDFCKKAEEDSENDYFFIIDEINRGNISKIFGELFMLIENDKRGIKLGLLYKDEEFSIPDNVYLIGTMNTADRSLAMIDYALRRRFAFYDIDPVFDSDVFKEHITSFKNQKLTELAKAIESINNSMISTDEGLGKGFRIGHSYLCFNKNISDNLEERLREIVHFELKPLLEEYWFDDQDKARKATSKLEEAIK